MRVNISSYLIIGPENTKGRPVEFIIKSALEAGFTCVQLRSKIASARELIELAKMCAATIADIKKSDKVALLVNDRLDVALAARSKGIKVDGVHVGQEDIPPEVCRKYLGDEAIVGFTPRKHKMIEYVNGLDFRGIDYLGVGPLHASTSKPDAGRQIDGSVVTRTLDELSELVKISPVPIVVGGGVTVEDLPVIASTGVDGFFVISAVASADDPYLAACKLVDIWNKCRALG